MDTVLDGNNYTKFNERISVTLPRNIKNTDNSKTFESYGIGEVEEMILSDDNLPKYLLIDVANGHMNKLYELTKYILDNYDINLMVGNIANPNTYKMYAKLGLYGVRVGIGGGSACTTSANSGVHYPMASLINECYKIKEKHNLKTKIIADGGFNNTANIIKALSIGADYVMIGGLMNKTFESCSDFYEKNTLNNFVKIDKPKTYIKNNNWYKRYRGMSTKEVQKDWGRTKLKTSEGIIKYNKVEYDLDGWLDNFEHYLRNMMSYTNSLNLSELKNSQFIRITSNSYDRFNK